MRTVLRQLGQYKRDAFFCIGLTSLEVIMEILLPFITAIIIDEGLEKANLSVVYRYGALMVVMAFFSLIFGATAGKFAAGNPSIPTFRPSPFPTLINSACLDWLPV